MTRSPEHDIQRALVKHLQVRLKPNVYWCAIPNAGKRTKALRGRLLAEGMRAGAPDLIFVIKGRAIALELKAPRGRQSDEQIDTQDEWEDAGGTYFVAYSLDDALEILELIGAIR